MKNFAIIGKGFIFQRHVDAINKNGGKVTLTCDIDPEKKADFLDYKEMLASERMKDIDAIIICTPNHLHKQMIKDSLATGKTVLCEKPLILDSDFSGLEGVNCVLQLRYHDFLCKMREAVKPTNNNIILDMRVCRDENWWKQWRGDESKSGGPLMGLAIHMFDFLILLLNDKYEIVNASNSKKQCFGEINFENNNSVIYNVEILENDDKKNQTRKFIINGEKFEMCNKDNLSFAGYHDVVIEKLMKDDGIPLDEAKKSIILIDKLRKTGWM